MSVARELAIAREARRLCGLLNSMMSHHLNDADVAALVAADRLWDFTHTCSQDTGWVRKSPPYIPSAQEVNAWSIEGMGHDSCNQWAVAEAECARLGVSPTCPDCQGEGSVWDSPENEALAEAWTATPPPLGEGYQMWETVSEGSAISPVFEIAEALAEWLADNRQNSVDDGTTAAQWLAFIQGPGWAPSFIGSPATGVIPGHQQASA